MTSQPALASSSRSSWVSGSNFAMAWATSRSTMTGAAAGAGGELLVDPAGAGVREAVGLLGDAAGLPGRYLARLDTSP